MSESLLRLPEVRLRTGLCTTAIYTGMQAGKFPLAIKEGRKSLWVASEVQAWIDAKVATAPRMGQGMGAGRRSKVSR